MKIIVVDSGGNSKTLTSKTILAAKDVLQTYLESRSGQRIAPSKLSGNWDDWMVLDVNQRQMKKFEQLQDGETYHVIKKS